MSMNLMAKAMSIKVGNPLRKLVLIKLADNANDEGECWPSYQHIADQCEVSRSTVKSHIRALEDMGLLKREFRRKGELNQSNVFYLTLDNAQQIPPESGGAGADLGGGAGVAPRTYHSFEPVKEPLERKKKPSSMPEGFSPSASHQKMAEEFGISLQDEFDKFTDHHLSKGSKFIDWNRALNTWLRNARGFQKSRACNSFSRPSSAITVSKTGYVFFDR
ncbi:helix-turn-helix domain-containing protein [Salmonella enterica subsp. enterica serovar Singapore]|uniref:Helix-turn-helix domain-containing protein n=1 Tax=Salmonella enterica subsp. enterica serovar Braenderup TaxID=149391 RepID=A0A733UYS8_SALET|nr:helix-turn-helix domain-containing protein [Salmonella enterica subsp. enterica serovar Singapore]EBW6070584.1 helix-turn-helix domain-containing protein [Salmonella enterica subsp. enterica serovar Braenderup]EDJ5365265.1 helix-turn-helix domain-containing protein [Salmonella enterica]EDV4548741.1 helix-turn-helix domain-containing protein [Salmonella enterica subsp. enterica serovar Livingstone]EBS3916725.1 helix-turn-helix domain-containing protein [Salmonella enterica subsp. enterica ser